MLSSEDFTDSVGLGTQDGCPVYQSLGPSTCPGWAWTCPGLFWLSKELSLCWDTVPKEQQRATKLKLSSLAHVWLLLSNVDIKKQQRSSFENYAHLHFNIWFILLQADWEPLNGRGCEVLRVNTELVVGTKHLAFVSLS